MRARRAADPEAERERDRKRYDRDRDKRLAAQKRWREKHPEVAAASVAKARAAWMDRNPEKRAAHIAVGNAVRDGVLVKGPCERAAEGGCSTRIEAHHDDYSKPLEVRWLCSRHHAEHRRLER